jgi:hypothetical protein
MRTHKGLELLLAGTHSSRGPGLGAVACSHRHGSGNAAVESRIIVSTIKDGRASRFFSGLILQDRPYGSNPFKKI